MPLCAVLLAVAGALDDAVVAALRQAAGVDTLIAAFLTHALSRYREHEPVRALAAGLFDVPQLHVRLLAEMATCSFADPSWLAAAEAAQAHGAIDAERVREGSYWLARLRARASRKPRGCAARA